MSYLSYIRREKIHHPHIITGIQKKIHQVMENHLRKKYYNDITYFIYIQEYVYLKIFEISYTTGKITNIFLKRFIFTKNLSKIIGK